jgi:UDP-glucuronate 4-epimerase
MHALVTGCAGFIGSHLSEALLARGDRVTGVDCLTSYYDIATKRANVEILNEHHRFTFSDADLRTAGLEGIVSGVDTIFHLAGQAGVRLSWSSGFDEYLSHNVLGTQRVLESAVSSGVSRLVFASSSSVYGQAATYPTTERDLPRPFSPYGVTKLAAEHMCVLYAMNHGLSTVALRYFTVYGPRQRPDMAMHRLFEAALAGTPFPLYGDGSARRDFSYVGDIVRANLAAADADLAPGTVMNAAGGGEVSMRELIDMASDAIGVPIRIDRQPGQNGDVDRTGGSNDLARKLMDWAPRTTLADGLAAQAAWHRSRSDR